MRIYSLQRKLAACCNQAVSRVYEIAPNLFLMECPEEHVSTARKLWLEHIAPSVTVHIIGV